MAYLLEMRAAMSLLNAKIMSCPGDSVFQKSLSKSGSSNLANVSSAMNPES